MTFFTANGGRANEGRMLINGMPVAASFNGGGVSTFIYDVANSEEMQVRVNLIPQSGGNSFNGEAFYSGTGNGLRSDNIDDSLRDIFSVKLTAQVSTKQRVSFSHEYQHRCSGSAISLNPNNIGGVGGNSATNGASLNANVILPNSPASASSVPGQPTVQDLLGGRLPAGSLPSGTTTINLLTTGDLYPDERLTQVDMRFAKISDSDRGAQMWALTSTTCSTPTTPPHSIRTSRCRPTEQRGCSRRRLFRRGLQGSTSRSAFSRISCGR